MSRDNWYRNVTWNAEIEEHFFEKLRRSRSQRDQYVVLQAAALVRSHPEQTIRLIDYYFETRTDTFDDIRAHNARAEALVAMGQTGAAIEAYKAVLQCEAILPSFRTNARVDLPFLIAQERVESEYEYALQLLDSAARESNPFPLYWFRLHAAFASILSATGAIARAKEHATAAVVAAQKTATPLPHHPRLGLVDERQNSVLREMYRIGA